MYDSNNIFAKILRGEIPCKKVYEDKYVLAFYDINPQVKIHVLVIPKGPFIDLVDFVKKASNEEIQGFFKGITKTAEILNILDSGFRYLGNNGKNAGQEVPHLHFHLFGGEKLGKMISK